MLHMCGLSIPATARILLPLIAKYSYIASNFEGGGPGVVSFPAISTIVHAVYVYRLASSQAPSLITNWIIMKHMIAIVLHKGHDEGCDVHL